MKSSTTVFALLLAAMTCQAVEPPAQTLTWQEANRRSAALIKEKGGPSTEAADLARTAFDLYPQQTKSYNATNHAQLLVNLADVRYGADGRDAAVQEIDRGAEAITRVAGPKTDVLIAVWQEGARFAGQGSRQAGRFREQALARAEEVLGPDDPRTISLLLDVVEDLRAIKGFAWAKSRYATARERAANAGEDSVRVAEVDLLRAKLQMQAGKTSAAIEDYRSLIERLEPRSDRETILQLAYAQLEVAHEVRRDTKAAADVRQRRAERLARSATDPGTGMGDSLVPLSRVTPQYPRRALELRQQGFVEFQLRVAPDGSVLDAKVLRSEPAGVFDASALKALRHWKFKPKIVDGQAVESSGTQMLTFGIEE